MTARLDITPLHVRSGYSLRRGTAMPDKLVARARAGGHTRLALTDVNALYGAAAFWAEAVAGGVEPIIGAELRDGQRAAVALVADDTGYANLCRLITRRHNGRAGTSLARDLAEMSRGLHVIVEEAALAGDLVRGGHCADGLWLGVDPGSQSLSVLRRLADGADALSLPLVATGRALFTDAADRPTVRLLTAMRLGTTFDGVTDEQLPPAGAYLRGAEQLSRELADWPGAAANNRLLADTCAAYRFLPRQPVFPSYPCPRGRSPEAELALLCGQGLSWRYGARRPAGADARVARELALIARMGFSEYFLVVWDIVRYARDLGVPVAGRGSGASSLAAYLLGITNVCPLTYDIPFERFLNEQRSDFPDLDVDFCWRIRDDVIDYVFRRWGADRTAMVCTHNTFRRRSAVRETAKALGFSEDQISRTEVACDDNAGRLARVGELSERVLGLPHTISVHPGGVVIAPGRLDRHAPIQTAPKGVPIVQYDKRGVKAVGLVKIDLLGNRSLSTIRAACDLIARDTGRRVHVERLADRDPATAAMLCSADTVGCNQIESPAMRHLLRALRPAGVGDLMKALAMVRPGAAGGGMKETFVRRMRGLEPVATGYGPVDRILADTFGVMLYEDDVMSVIAAMLATGPAEADRFRKAIQTCRHDDERIDLSRRFLDGCGRNALDRRYAKDMWVQMAKFNAYSFCRAHAGSYAVLAYAVAWLKCHYPLQFWTAALNNNQSMYPPRVYVEQARRSGVRFALPDVNSSQGEFDVQDGAIRTGLGWIAGLGPAGVQTILEQRRRGGPFAHLSDFVFRTRLGREETRSLILCGAMDFTARSRPALMLELDLAISAADALGGAGLIAPRADVPDVVDDFAPLRKYADERRALGFSVDRHIMTLWRGGLRGRVDADSRALPRRVGRRVRIAGVLEARRTTQTQKQRRMMFLTLDDEFGLFEAGVFPDACENCPPLTSYGPYIITARVEERHGTLTITAESVDLWKPEKRQRPYPQISQITQI